MTVVVAMQSSLTENFKMDNQIEKSQDDDSLLVSKNKYIPT
jgi:hypothetical protein